MFEKQLQFSDDARNPIFNGAQKGARAVLSTLGPHGRNVAIRKKAMSPPLITKDGVTVIKEIRALPDPYEDMGLQMLKEAASKTNDLAGDGTTTSTLLGYEMMKAGLEQIKSGVNAIHIRRGMNMACVSIVDQLSKQSIVVDKPDQFKSIATISSQDEEIGGLVAEVVDEVGENGVITVQAGINAGISYAMDEGMQLASGFISKYFMTNPTRLSATLEKPFILVTDERITNIEQILPVINMVAEAKGCLVIIAETIEGNALSTLYMNLPTVKVQGQKAEDKANFVSLAIRAPEIGDRRNDVLQDIAVKCGALLVTKKIGLELKNVTIDDLGRADRIVAYEHSSAIIGGAGDELKIAEREDQIKEAISTATGEDLDFLRGRLGNFIGKIAVITVGSATEAEQKEKQHRVEDAIAAVRAAAQEGIVAGGGKALLSCVCGAPDNLTKDEIIGWNIVMDTLKKPLWWIAQNAGYDGDKVVKNVMEDKQGRGFNAETGEYVDMIENDIIDPKKVSRCALENAVSVASTFITLEVAIVDVEDPNKNFQQQ